MKYCLNTKNHKSLNYVPVYLIDMDYTYTDPLLNTAFVPSPRTNAILSEDENLSTRDNTRFYEDVSSFISSSSRFSMFHMYIY